MIGPDKEQFEKPFLLLCEGANDKRFFQNFLKFHDLCDFVVRYPYSEGKNGYTGGWENFHKDLPLVAINESFIKHVRAILIVSDNDDDPAKSFSRIQEEVRKAGFPVPVAERAVAKADGKPSVSILMLPIGDAGNIESVCLEAAHSKWGLVEVLNAFVAATPASAFKVGKQAKMRLQALLAAVNDHQPDCGFGNHWRQPEQYHIPLGNDAFGEIITFLKGFPAMVGA